MKIVCLLIGLLTSAHAVAQSTLSPPAGVTRVEIPAFSHEPLAIPYNLFQTNANLALSAYLTGGNTNTGDRLHFYSHDLQQFNTYVKLDGTGNPALDGKWVRVSNTNDVLDVQLIPGVGFFASNERFFPQSVYVAGMVPLTAQTLPLLPGYGMMGNPYPAGIRLDATSLREDGALGGVDFGTADNVLDWLGGQGGYASYFLVDYPLEPTLHGRWVDEGLNPTNPWIKIARGFFYNRNAATTLAWNPPIPYSATPAFNSGATPPAIVSILAGTNGVNLVTFTASTAGSTTYQIFTLDLSPTGMPVFDGGWRLADVTLPATGSALMSFYDDGTHTGAAPCSINRPTRLYIVARGDLDFDSDRKSDAVERLRDRSNPAYANADPYPSGASIALPRRLQVENYDSPYIHPVTGLLIKPYVDGTAGNQGGSYRADDVDIYTGFADSLDASPHYVYMDDWEWMSYQVENTNAVSTLYDLEIRYTSIRSTDVAKLSLDGVLISTVSLPDSGLNWFWRSILVRNISIPPGRHTFAIGSTVNNGGRYNLNYLEFLNAGVAPDIVPAVPYFGTPNVLPGRIQAEHFDAGYMPEAYNDRTAGNGGSDPSFRGAEHMDIDSYVHEGLPVRTVYMAAYESMGYTVNVPVAGTYDIAIRYGTINVAPSINRSPFHLTWPGGTTGPLYPQNSGMASNLRTHVVRGVSLPAGVYQIRLTSSPGSNYSGQAQIDWFEIQPPGVIPDAPTNTPYLGVAPLLPGRVEAETFDLGPMVDAYFDTTYGNSGSDPSFRPNDHVEVYSYVHEGAPVRTVHLSQYESTGYTVNVPLAGNYDIAIRYGTINVDVALGRSPFRLTWPGGTTGPLYPANSGWATNLRTHVVRGVPLPSGTYQIRITTTEGSNYSGQAHLDWFEVQPPGVIPEPPSNTPFFGSPAPLPGRLEAEHFDQGPMTDAYYDTSAGNAGTAASFRPNDHVDIYALADGSPSDRSVYISPGESLGFTVNVPVAGSYDIAFRYGTLNSNPTLQRYPFLLSWPGETTGPLYPPITAYNSLFRTFVVRNQFLPSGTYQMRLGAYGTYNAQAYVNWFEVQPAGVMPDPDLSVPFFGSPIAIPARIEAEDFDSGNYSVVYFDRTAGNTMGAYRLDTPVEIASIPDQGSSFQIHLDYGEFVQYSISVPETKAYNLALRVRSQYSGRYLSLWLDGAPLGSNVNLPMTGANGMATVLVNNLTLPAGQHILRLQGGSSSNGSSANFFVNHLTLYDSSDSDADGMWDNWEWTTIRLNPSDNLNSLADITAEGDINGNGVNNLTEYRTYARDTVVGTVGPYIQAEDYDAGGHQHAYVDTTPLTNIGGVHRTDGVDIWDTPNTGDESPTLISVGGESLNYTVDVAANGLYDLELELGWTSPSDVWSLFVDGLPVGTAANLPPFVHVNGWYYVRPTVLRDLPLAPGRHILTLRNDVALEGNTAFNRFRLAPAGVIPPVPVHAPFAGQPWPVPGLIQAEDFDAGPMPEAYLDLTAGNAGGVHRPNDHADIYLVGANASPVVRFGGNGLERLNYTVHVTSGGMYDLVLRYANTNEYADVVVSLDGSWVHYGVLPPTTADDDFSVYRIESIPLSAGTHVIGLENNAFFPTEEEGWSFDHLEVATHSFDTALPPLPYPGNTFPTLPGLIQAENFDQGGEGVAYHDLDPLNTGGQYRPSEGVDIHPGDDPGQNSPVVSLHETEWLVWSFELAESTTVQVTFRYRLDSDNSLVLTAGFLGIGAEAALEFAPTGANYQTVTLGGPVALPQGRHSFKLNGSPAALLSADILLNWIAIGDPDDLDADGLPNVWESQYSLDGLNASDAGADPDGDQLTNMEEYLAGSNPHSLDSDGDLLSDRVEIQRFGTSPSSASTGNNGLLDSYQMLGIPTSNANTPVPLLTLPANPAYTVCPNGQFSARVIFSGWLPSRDYEIYLSTRLANIGENGPGHPINDKTKTYLVRREYSPAESGSTYTLCGEELRFQQMAFGYIFWGESGDADNDGLSDMYEILVTRTLPHESDSDRDSVPDGEEDSDLDGLSDRGEYQLGSYPWKADTDSDGVNDFNENYYQSDVNSSAGQDPDGDGLSTATELASGTSPINDDSDWDGVLDNGKMIVRGRVGMADSRQRFTGSFVVVADPSGFTTGMQGQYSTSAPIGGKFEFVLPNAPTMHFCAFIDRNEDGVFQPDREAGATQVVLSVTSAAAQGVDLVLLGDPNAINGVPNWWQLEQGRFFSQGANGDDDGDKVSNLDEYYLQTSGFSGLPESNTDADADGMSDDWERLHGLSGSTAHDRYLDPDKDGFSNMQEFNSGSFGTNPRVPNDVITQNPMTLFIDNVDGSDTSGDGTRENPYKSLQIAFNQIPMNAAGHLVLLSDYTVFEQPSLKLQGNKDVFISGVGDISIYYGTLELDGLLDCHVFNLRFASSSTGALIAKSTDIVLSQCAFEGNSVQGIPGRGGAVTLVDCDYLITESKFINNWNIAPGPVTGGLPGMEAGSAGVFAMTSVPQQPHTGLIHASEFRQNYAQYVNGTAVCAFNQDLFMDGCSVVGNNANNSSPTIGAGVFVGGPAALAGSSGLHVYGCTFLRNVSYTPTAQDCVIGLGNAGLDASNSIFSYDGTASFGLYPNSSHGTTPWGGNNNCIQDISSIPLNYAFMNSWTEAPLLDSVSGVLTSLSPYRGSASTYDLANFPIVKGIQMGLVDASGRLRSASTSFSLGAWNYDLQEASGIAYVDLNSPNPQFPYTSLETAARSIQDGINAVSPGGRVIVHPGDYCFGQAASPEDQVPARVVVNNAAHISAIGGPSQTRILGARPGTRCAYLGDNAILEGFTIQEGFSPANGGGVYMHPTAQMLNCIVQKCVAADAGSAVYGGSLRGCIVHLNGGSGGAVARSELDSCSVVHNTSPGITYAVKVVNSIVDLNGALDIEGDTTNFYFSRSSNPHVDNISNGYLVGDVLFAPNANGKLYNPHVRSEIRNQAMMEPWMFGNSFDIYGTRRIQNGVADCGAVESLVSGRAIRNLKVDDAVFTNDDGTYVDYIEFDNVINFYGSTQENFYLNNNGNVTFNGGLTTFNPDLFTQSHSILAPFWADVDTRDWQIYPSNLGTLTYGRDILDGRNVIHCTWSAVDYYRRAFGRLFFQQEKRNTFQMILTERPDRETGDFDLEYNYDQIQWETGDASGGDDGLNGQSVEVGITAANSNRGFIWPGSGVDGSLLDTGANPLRKVKLGSSQPGRMKFSFRGGYPLELLAGYDMAVDPLFTLEGGWAYSQSKIQISQFPLENPSSASTPAFSTADKTSIYLIYRRNLVVEEGDTASIQVRSGGEAGVWQTVWSNDGLAINDGNAEITQSLDISTWADNKSSVEVRWLAGPRQETGNQDSWSVSDVRILHLFHDGVGGD